VTQEKRFFLRFGLACYLLAAAILACSCSTVTPKLVAPPVATASVVKVDGGYLITAEELARYNDLIKLGYGSEKAGYLPPIKKNAGVTVRPDGTIFIDNEHMTDFAAMNRLFHSNIQP
jgi:hypothetical protein